MSYQFDKETGDIIIKGWEFGINGNKYNPQGGAAAIYNGNISTEAGEVMCNFQRNPQILNIGLGTLSFLTNSTLSYIPGTNPALTVGTALVITSGIGGLSASTYWVVSISGTSPQTIQIAATYNGATLSGFSAGSATFNTVTPDLDFVYADSNSSTEIYYDSSNNQQYRLYMVTKTGKAWCYDSALIAAGYSWFWIGNTGQAPNNNCGGFCVRNGFLHIFVENQIFTIATAILSKAPSGLGSAIQNMLTLPGSKNPHFGYYSTGAASIMIGDSHYIDYIFPCSASTGTSINVQGWGSYTFATTTLTLSVLNFGDFPGNGQTITFYSSGTVPTGVTANTVAYFVVNANITNKTFQVAATVGGSAISLSSGSGTQYFNTYNPSAGVTMGQITGNGTSPVLAQGFVPAALTLANGEIVASMLELNDELSIGTLAPSNNFYFWNQFSPSASSKIILEEAGVPIQAQADNVLVFPCGVKGNYYQTQGSATSKIISVPDYMAGIPGNPTSYIEPYFTPGGMFFDRGRIWFAIRDENANKAGNCGGIYSFVSLPGQLPNESATGSQLHLENQNSYGTYNGLANALITFPNQIAVGIQYASGWTSTVGNSPGYGIDNSGTTPYTGGQTIIETELIPVGTYFNKGSFAQIEYILASPLISGESVAISWRQNATDVWTPLSQINFQQEASNPISGVFTVNFQNFQWLQLQIILTSTAINPSFVRLAQVRIR